LTVPPVTKSGPSACASKSIAPIAWYESARQSAPASWAMRAISATS
jgi:hypothetical protein